MSAPPTGLPRSHHTARASSLTGKDPEPVRDLEVDPRTATLDIFYVSGIGWR